MITYKLLQFAGFYGYTLAALLSVSAILENHFYIKLISKEDTSGLMCAGLVGFFSCLILVFNERNKKPGI